MFERKKDNQEPNYESTNGEIAQNNKMDDKQKAEFLQAMGVKSTSDFEESKIKEEKQDKQVFKSRAERRALSEGYTRPVAPIPVQADDVKKVTKATKVEQTTIKMNLNNMKTDITVDDLYDTLAEVQHYQSKDFTEESWLPFVTVFTQALTVYQSDEPTVEEILIARDAVLIAKNKLVRID